MQKITPFLWFDDKAEEAAAFYVSVFKNSRMGRVMRLSEAAPGPQGGASTVSFSLDGIEFTALNGGPYFKFSEAISFFVDCEDQAEVDDLWDKLTADGGQPGQCGWLKDKYGVSWQIVPRVLMALLADPDPAKARRVTEAMLKMVKIDVATLEAAAAG